MTVKTLMAVLAMLGSLASEAADTWYVDAAAAAGGDGSEAKPFAVIQDAVDKAAGGDTIYVAAGEYKTGGKDTYGWSRVEIVGKPGLKLIGAGCGKSFIVGSRDPAAGDAYAEDDGTLCRCVCVATSSGAIVKGFTLRDGETGTSGTSAAQKNTGGGFKADADDAYLVDCEVSHCAGKYGSPIYQGTAVRCLFDRNFGTGGPGGRGARLVNTVVTRSKPSGGSTGTLYECRIYNCTVVDNATVWATQTDGDEVYNSVLVLSNNSDEDYRDTNKVCRVENSVLSQTAPNSYRQLVGPLVGDWRLLADSDAVNAADAKWLAGLNLPADVGAFRDFNNRPIPTSGAINAGAIQETVRPAGGALYFTKACDAEVNGHAMIRAKLGYVYPETYPTQYCVRPVLAEGEYLYRIGRNSPAGSLYQAEYPALVPRSEGGAVWMIPPPDVSVPSTNVVTKATTVLWCDAGENGSDEDGDGTELKPYKTLMKAVSTVASKTPTVIFAKPGRYDADTPTEFDKYGAFRLYVSGSNKYIRFASTDGPAWTSIAGAADPKSTDKDYPGCGSNAVKCVYLSGAGLILQGFTLTDGRGYGAGASQGERYASAVMAGSGDATRPLITDCVISNCVARDYLCAHGIYSRCEFTANISANSIITGEKVSACYFHDNDLRISGSGPGGTVASADIFNSTLIGTPRSGRVSSGAVPSYNTIFDGGANVYSTSVFTNCLIYNIAHDYHNDETCVCKIADPLFASRAASPVLADDSPAIGYGCAPTADNYGTLWWRYMNGDFYGQPIAIDAEGHPTVGAAQQTVPVRIVEFTEPTDGGLALRDAAFGTIRLYEGFPGFSVEPASCSRPCGGVKVGETSHWFTNTTDYVLSLDYASFDGCASPLTVEPIYTTDWYVDDDGDNANSGMLPNLARRTLVSAIGRCAVGDTLWALPGTYDEDETIPNKNYAVSNRVYVKKGVWLRSTHGAEKTFIVGSPAKTNPDEYGCGVDAVRCVGLGGEGGISGFTLTGGRVNLDPVKIADGGTLLASEDGYGGGVLGFSGGSGRELAKGVWVEDCIISNCVGGTGCGATRVCLIRSKVVGNTSPISNGSAVYQSSAFGSYIDDNVASEVFSYSLDIVGSTVGPRNRTMADGVPNCSGHTIGNGIGFLNSLFCVPLTPGGSLMTTIRNCVCARGSKLDTNNHADTNETVVVAADADGVAIDKNGVPVIGKCLAVDAGSAEWFGVGTNGLFSAEVDLAGNQRIYNGTVDAGCFEADWRPVYAKCIGRPKYVSVTAADPSVKTDENGRVTIPSGSLAATLTNDGGADAAYVLKVAATGGALTVSVDGEPVGEPIVSGTREIELKGLNALVRLDFAFEPSAENPGEAVIVSVRRQTGMMLIVR